MKPITSRTELAPPPEAVFEYLAVLANHERFCDHYLTDWTASGPAAGVGATVRVKAKTPGPDDWLDIRIIQVHPPNRLVEETIGAGGKRRSRGTWTLEPRPDGGTDARFELVVEAMPPLERLLAPLSRGWLQRGNDRALQRLRELLAA